MLQIFEIELYQIKRYVTIAFCGDHDLVHKYHIVNGRLTDCVESTVKQITITSKDYVLRYYALFYNSLPIGFTVISVVSKLLYSFGINIMYRKKEIIKEWFDFLKSMLSNGITCILHNKNTRTIDFLVRNGLKIESADNGLTVLKST
jgi:hypothetical protein